MKRRLPSAAKGGNTSLSSTKSDPAKAASRVRYAAGRLIVDQDGERIVGFRTRFAFVWADRVVASRYALSANDPKFRFIV